jgi:hypothetical protein
MALETPRIAQSVRGNMANSGINIAPQELVAKRDRRNCNFCGNELPLILNKGNLKRQKYCSKKCRQKANRLRNIETSRRWDRTHQRQRTINNRVRISKLPGYKKNKPLLSIKTECLMCKKLIFAAYLNATAGINKRRYCSKRCCSKHYQILHPKKHIVKTEKCMMCGNVFIIRTNKKYCSKKCFKRAHPAGLSSNRYRKRYPEKNKENLALYHRFGTTKVPLICKKITAIGRVFAKGKINSSIINSISEGRTHEAYI